MSASYVLRFTLYVLLSLTNNLSTGRFFLELLEETIRGLSKYGSLWQAHFALYGLLLLAVLPVTSALSSAPLSTHAIRVTLWPQSCETWGNPLSGRLSAGANCRRLSGGALVS